MTLFNTLLSCHLSEIIYYLCFQLLIIIIIIEVNSEGKGEKKWDGEENEKGEIGGDGVRITTVTFQNQLKQTAIKI